MDPKVEKIGKAFIVDPNPSTTTTILSSKPLL